MAKRSILVLALAGLFTLNAFPDGQADDRTDLLSIPATNDGLPGTGPIRRYEWFQKLWKQKRTAFASEINNKQGAVVFLGDSITQGWGPNLKNSFGDLLVANRGISGDTTRGMLIRMKEDVLSLNPKGIVMLMGTNDLEEKANPETISANINLILDRLAEHKADLPVVLCCVFPSSASKARPADSIQHINRLLQKSVVDRPNVTLLDTWTLFANAEGDARKSEFPDLLHPNAKGYAMWAAALTPVLETLQLADAPVATESTEEGYRALFNGVDLTGWGLRPTTAQMKKSAARWQQRDPNAPPWPIVEKALPLAGKTKSPDGRYQAINGRLVVTIPPTGRSIQQLWTTEEFDQDFELKLQFRASPNADSGIFIRGKQLQCRDFILAGPYKNLKDYRPQDWNEVVIKVTGAVAHCTCNGEVLEEAFKVPASGPLGLEGDRGQMEYRKIRLKVE